MVHLSQGTVSAEIQRDPCKVRSNLFNFSVLAKEIRFEAFATCVEIRHASLKVSFAFFRTFLLAKSLVLRHLRLEVSKKEVPEFCFEIRHAILQSFKSNLFAFSWMPELPLDIVF